MDTPLAYWARLKKPTPWKNLPPMNSSGKSKAWSASPRLSSWLTRERRYVTPCFRQPTMLLWRLIRRAKHPPSACWIPALQAPAMTPGIWLASAHPPLPPLNFLRRFTKLANTAYPQDGTKAYHFRIDVGSWTGEDTKPATSVGRTATLYRDGEADIQVDTDGRAAVSRIKDHKRDGN